MGEPIFRSVSKALARADERTDAKARAMAEGDICLRIRFPSKMESLRCPADCTFGALKALIAQAGGVAEETLRCSHGFPPSALDLEDDAPIAGTLSNMDTLIVHAENDAGQAVAPAKGKGSKPPKAKAASSSASDSANVATLHGSGGSGSGASNGKKRAAGGGGGGKRRAVGALKLGSEDGIGESLASAVSSRKGLAALGKEDPAMAFFKAAAASALVHHQEEVLANDRFKATLAGNYEVQEVRRRGWDQQEKCPGCRWHAPLWHPIWRLKRSLAGLRSRGGTCYLHSYPPPNIRAPWPCSRRPALP
jgi:hypothetical protein